MSVRLRCKAARAVVAVAMAVPFLLPFAACGPTAADRALDRAEALMEERPDSAAVILDSLANSKITSSPDYHLLKCETRWQLDSNPVCGETPGFKPEQFEKNRFREMKAYFLKSLKADDILESDESIVSAAKAYYIALDENNDLWTARILRRMADIYAASYNHIKAAEYYGKASVYFDKAGLESHAVYSKIDRAVCLLNQNRTEESVSLLDSILSISRAQKDPDLEAACLHSLVPANLFLGDTKAASRQLDSLKTLSAEGYYEYGNEAMISEITLLVKSGASDSAKSIIRQLDFESLHESEKIRIYQQLVGIGIIEGNTDFARSVNDSIYTIQDKAIRRILDHYVIDSHNDLEVDLKNQALRKNSHLTNWVVILTLSILLLSVSVCWIWLSYRNYRRIKDLRLTEALADASMLRDTLGEMEKRLVGYDADRKSKEERILSILKKSYASSWETLNNISREYMNPSSAKMNGEPVRNLIEGLLKDMRRPEKLDEIIGTVDMTHGGVIGKARDEFSLRKDAYRLVALSLSGLSPKSVALLLDMDINYYYKKRKRILNKTAASQYPEIRDIAEKLTSPRPI